MGYPIEIHFGRNLDQPEVKAPPAERAVARPRAFSHSRFLAELTADSALPSVLNNSNFQHLDISPLLMFLSSRELERVRAGRRANLPAAIQAAPLTRPEGGEGEWTLSS
eukprot:TRINITY_DN2524_c0_g1_i1.p1 TRINITY_DN2524_c0_g1~~TRINITY_DN2524_c0_g1_i1.p1  ORF type:complete len:109 (-),score=14.46 TRINITY_DN2524_c0_g1_i1:276-602(-)